MSIQDHEKNKRLHETIESLADSPTLKMARETVKLWNEHAAGPDGACELDADECLAKHIAALLDTACDEAQEIIHEQWRVRTLVLMGDIDKLKKESAKAREDELERFADQFCRTEVADYVSARLATLRAEKEQK